MEKKFTQVKTRRRRKSTVLIRWLDRAVEQNVLVPANGGTIAKGALHIGELFQRMIQ